MDKKEADRLYYLKNKERIKEQRRKRYLENKEKELENSKKYYSEHIDEITQYQRQYRIDNEEKLDAYKKKYYSTKKGRAIRLSAHYRMEDERNNRGESTITPEWIIDNIFSKSCHYCGETDWHKLGCDRKDNKLPHTPENVVPCCFNCNREKNTMGYDEYMSKKEKGLH